MRRPRWLMPIAVAVAVVLPGCVEQYESAGFNVYRFDSEAIARTAGVFAVPLILGLLIRWWGRREQRKHRAAASTAALKDGRRKIWVGNVLAVLGLIGTLVFIPGMFRENITVGPEGFTARTGFWFYPRTVTVNFEDTERIVIRDVVAQADDQSLLPYFATFRFYDRTGAYRDLRLTTVLSHAATEIAEHAHMAGVIIDEGE